MVEQIQEKFNLKFNIEHITFGLEFNVHLTNLRKYLEDVELDNLENRQKQGTNGRKQPDSTAIIREAAENMRKF